MAMLNNQMVVSMVYKPTFTSLEVGHHLVPPGPHFSGSGVDPSSVKPACKGKLRARRSRSALALGRVLGAFHS